MCIDSYTKDLIELKYCDSKITDKNLNARCEKISIIFNKFLNKKYFFNNDVTICNNILIPGFDKECMSQLMYDDNVEMYN